MGDSRRYFFIWSVVKLIMKINQFFKGDVEYKGAVEGMEAHAGSSYSCQTGFNSTLTADNLNNATYR